MNKKKHQELIAITNWLNIVEIEKFCNKLVRETKLKITNLMIKDIAYNQHINLQSKNKTYG
jgi:hypothetical protein